jgi:hypothetical protein
MATGILFDGLPQAQGAPGQGGRISERKQAPTLDGWGPVCLSLDSQESLGALGGFGGCVAGGIEHDAECRQ